MISRRARVSEYTREELDDWSYDSKDGSGFDNLEIQSPRERIEKVRSKYNSYTPDRQTHNHRQSIPPSSRMPELASISKTVLKQVSVAIVKIVGKIAKIILKKPVKAVACLILAVVLLYFAAVGILLKDMGRFDIKRDWKNTPAEAVSKLPLKSFGATNILVLGLDENGKGARSDTNMVLSINSFTGKVSMVSFLRDCYVEVPGHGSTKLNHAHAYGGPALTVQTIERNFRIKIHGVITLSMDSLAEIVRSMGGVTVEITAAEAEVLTSLGGGEYSAGRQYLYPEHAAYFSRIRAIDNDFGRTERQRRLIMAMIDEFKRMKPGQIASVIKKSAPFLATNMSDVDIGWLGLRLFLGMTSGSAQQVSVPWPDTYAFENEGDMMVVTLDLPENVRRLHKLLY